MLKITLWGRPVEVSFAKRRPKWCGKGKGLAWMEVGDRSRYCNGTYRVWDDPKQDRNGMIVSWRHEAGHILGDLLKEECIPTIEAEGEAFADLCVYSFDQIAKVEHYIREEYSDR